MTCCHLLAEIGSSQSGQSADPPRRIDGTGGSLPPPPPGPVCVLGFGASWNTPAPPLSPVWADSKATDQPVLKHWQPIACISLYRTDDANATSIAENHDYFFELAVAAQPVLNHIDNNHFVKRSAG